MTGQPIEALSAVMDDATSGFVQPGYAVEGLEAAVAAGWTITPPPADPVTGREYLEPLPAETERLRGVRKQPPALFDDLTVPELEQAARWLRAAAFNAQVGADHLVHIARTRTETTP